MNELKNDYYFKDEEKGGIKSSMNCKLIEDCLIYNDFFEINCNNNSKEIIPKSQNLQENNNEIKPKIEEKQQWQSKRGHFEMGDIPNKILDCFRLNDKIYVSVEWKTRQNGLNPKETSMETKKVKKYYPDILIQFYESRLNFRKKLNLRDRFFIFLINNKFIINFF